MKLLLTLFSIVLCSGLVCSQTPSTPETMITHMINSGEYEGHNAKVIGPMGDAAAVVVTKVLADKSITSDQIDSVLLILYSAFADPSMVEVVSDRQPRTALFVLQYMDSM